jgi:catechol 2,3-dioxygenase-like lactoylglutathione lyase family enzyme
MLTNKKVKAFVITTNAQESKKFYSDNLGFKFLSEDPYGLEFELNNALLRISIVPEYTPQKHTVLGWNVPDLYKEIDFLKNKGIVFEEYDFLQQDESGVWTAPDGTRIAWFKDPCGNLLSIDDKN